MQEMFSALDHAPTRICVEAERAMNRALHGSCHVPVAAYAQLRGDRLQLSGLVGSASDGRMARAQDEAASDAPEALGQAVARELLAQGAGEFL
jgi:hydroxymethylbilane synthase